MTWKVCLPFTRSVIEKYGIFLMYNKRTGKEKGKKRYSLPNFRLCRMSTPVANLSCYTGIVHQVISFLYFLIRIFYRRIVRHHFLLYAFDSPVRVLVG